MKEQEVPGEEKMPEGWNPSDDSEDDYRPEKKGGRKREEEDSEDEVKPKRSRPTPRRAPGSAGTPWGGRGRGGGQGGARGKVVVKAEEEGKVVDVCFLCKQEVTRGAGGSFMSLRFHFTAAHYYPEGSFFELAPPKEEDLPEGGKLPKDESGKVWKYTCHLQPCTKRQLGYKELVMHLATQHHRLREVMAGDARPGAAAAFRLLYPEDKVEKVAVKVEKVADKVAVKVAEKVVYSQKVVEKVGGKVVMAAVERAEEEDVDDPGYQEAPARPVVKPKVDVKPKVEVKPKVDVKKERTGPRIDKVHNCVLCNDKEGRNLSFGTGLSELRNHYSVCLYNFGWFVGVLAPGAENSTAEGRAVDEFARQWRYKCTVPNCPRSESKARPIGFKEFCIHAGVAHHYVELAMARAVPTKPKLVEVLETVAEARRAADEDGLEEVVEMPDVTVEEIHTCLICGGKDREGRDLSLDPNKLWSVRYHYAGCYFDTGVYLKLYPPGEANMEEGRVKDALGKEVKYTCNNDRCTMKRKVGYKEFCIHMASYHGGLEEVMKEDEREEIRALVPKLRHRV